MEETLPIQSSASGLDLVQEDGLFPPSVPTHSLSHPLSPSFYLSPFHLTRHHIATAFAAVRSSPAAHCSYSMFILRK